MDKRKLEIRELTRLRTKKYHEMKTLQAEITGNIQKYGTITSTEGNVK